jgi:protein disulfide-isomerase A6
LVDYINSKAGKHRLAGGALDDNAGRIVDLDELAKKLAAATTEAEKEDVYTEVDEVVAKTKSKYYSFIPTNASDAKYYAKVFEKLKTNPEYVANEKHRLEAIVAKGNMASDKYLPT